MEEKVKELEAKIASLNRFIADEFAELRRIKEMLRWRDAKKEPPIKNGCYLTAQNMSLKPSDDPDYIIQECDYRQGMWLLDSFVAYWRPIGPLPKESE